MTLSEIVFVLWKFHLEDAEKALTLGPLLAKINTMKVIGIKGSVSLIDYKLLETATNNFEESNILGEGGFGRVYRARLDDNSHVAVKKVDGTGHDAEREFEVCIICYETQIYLQYLIMFLTI